MICIGSEGGGAVRTIDSLVGEVAKSLNAVKSAPKQQESSANAALPKGKTEPRKAKTAAENKCPQKMTLDMAKELAKASEKAAEILGIKIVVAVRDEGANLVLLHAMDDSYIASVQAAQDKAYTAVALKMPTHKALEESRGGALDGLTNGNGIMLLGGGYPLERANKIYGGLGISGGSKEQDTVIAAAAAEYFKIRFK